VKKLAWLVILVIALVGSAYAVDKSLLAYSLQSASQQSLDSIASAYGLESSERSFVISSLLGSEVEAYPLDRKAEAEAEQRFTLSILSADTLSANGSRISLEGSVSLQFIYQEDSASLKANLVFIDTSAKSIVAMSGVKLERSGEEAVEGELVSLFWEKGDVKVSYGSRTVSRQSSEKEKLDLYTSGKLVSYSGNSSMINFSDGFIATSAESPYWSIKSKSITLMDGGDLFIGSASLAMGRVSVFWLPFFFYPSTRLVFNPAIGLSSSRGMFLNTTYEIYGSYTGLLESAGSSSLSMLLSSGADTSKSKSGLVYGETDEKLSDLESWAQESGSYMAVLADVYEKGGLFAGLDSSSNLLGSKLKLKVLAGIGIDPSRTVDKLRWLASLDLSYNASGSSFSLRMPWLSEYAVSQDYLNRLGTFTLDSVLGSQQKFPTTYTSSSTLEWMASGSIKLEVPSLLKTLVSDISISTIQAKLAFKRVLADDGLYHYEPQASVLPSLEAGISGTIMDLESRSQAKAALHPLAREFEQQAQQASALESEDLSSLEVSQAVIEADSSELSHKLSLRYAFKEVLSNSYEDAGFQDHAFSSLSTLKLTLSGAVGPRLFTLNQSITPSYKVSGTASATQDFHIDSDLACSIPILGLSYSLKQRIYSLLDVDGETQVNESFKWDSANVTDHSITLSRAFSAFSLGLSWTLKPLAQALVPSAGLKTEAVDAKASWKLAYDEASTLLKPSTASFKLGLSLLPFAFNASMNFDSSKPILQTMVLDQSASLSLLEGKLKLSQSYRAGKSFATEYLKAGLELPWASARITMKETEGSLGPDSLNVSLFFKDKAIAFWKNRIRLTASLESSLAYSFVNIYSTTFSINGSLEVLIPEFLSLKMSIKSANNGFYNYYEDGKFSLSAMLEDLARSFDFIGDGRMRTSFNLSSFSVEAVHYMKDWDLHCTYCSSVVLLEGQWRFKSTVSVYCQWKAIAELKVENEKEWTR
jgi:hypothetical protein